MRLILWPRHSKGATPSETLILRLTASGSKSVVVVPSSTRPCRVTAPEQKRSASASEVFPDPPWPTRTTLRIFAGGKLRIRTSLVSRPDPPPGVGAAYRPGREARSAGRPLDGGQVEQQALLADAREADARLGPLPLAADVQHHPLAPLGVHDGLPRPQLEGLGPRAPHRCRPAPAEGRLDDLLPGRGGAAPPEARSGPAPLGPDRLVGDLGQEAAGRVVLRLAPEVAAPGVRQVQPVARPGDAHVGEPTLLFELVGLAEGAEVGKDPVLHADDEDGGELEPLGRVQGHEEDLRVIGPAARCGVLVDLVGVGHEADLLQEALEGACLAGGADQLLEVLDPAG